MIVCAGLGCRDQAWIKLWWGSDGGRLDVVDGAPPAVPGGGFFCRPCGALIQGAGELPEPAPSR